MSQLPTEQTTWEHALHEAFPDGIPRSAIITDRAQMTRILHPFCRRNFNHVMMPGGGGMDIHLVNNNRTDGTLELGVSPRHAYACNPTSIYFEYIDGRPEQSFFLIENGDLDVSGAYEDINKEETFHEEIVELSCGKYLGRHYWDQGIEGYDEHGYEIPMRNSARLLIRFWSGKFLVVFKRSIWNCNSATYDGRHSRMSSAEIREQIEGAIARGKARREVG